MHLLLDNFASPLGTIRLVHDADGFLRALDFHDHDDRLHRLLRRHYGSVTLTRMPPPARVRALLAAYFAGDHAATLAVPVATGGTAFQRAVWAALRAIPHGETRSYGAVAAAVGAPKAVRAVGLANGANPVAIVVPCHRVIGADGSLTGFGGGLPRKRWLLAHEGVAVAPERAATLL